MDTKLEVGMLITAKIPCRMGNKRDALVVGKDYKIHKISPTSFWINSEVDARNEFIITSFDKYFEIHPQGVKLEFPKHVSEVKLLPPSGFVIDIENSDLTTGIIKYKKDKSTRPMCMEDLGDHIDGCYITGTDNTISRIHQAVNKSDNHNLWPSRKWAESVQAQGKLVRLRDAWNEGWKLDYKEDVMKYHILLAGNEITIDTWWGIASFLVFKDKQTAAEFLETFRDLIETYFKPYKS